MDKYLLSILVCPLCKASLVYEKSAQELICRFDRLAFPIRDEIPKTFHYLRRNYNLILVCPFR